MSVTATWTLPSSLTIENKAKNVLSSGEIESTIELITLPCHLQRSIDDDKKDEQCEILLNFASNPLQCTELDIAITSSARHIEIYINGIRRNLLGEDEQAEVYFGTFRGTTDRKQYFSVQQHFTQHQNEFNVLKCVHTLRVKFVSLKDNKNQLELVKFQCIYHLPAEIPNATRYIDTSFPDKY